jgi:hypothetical protein
VRFRPCAIDDALQGADEAVLWLLDNGWTDRDIAVLTTGWRHYAQTARSEEEWAAYWDAFFDSDEVFYGHVLGFKGLERSADLDYIGRLGGEAVRKRLAKAPGLD